MVKLEDFTVGEIKKMISKYNKQVKITTSGIKKADLIKKIREHPKLTVTESDKGINIKVKSDSTMGGKKIKIKKDEKPKVPTITVTEEEKPKKKVIKRGGRFITVKPKEPKADLPPIPKPKAKIRIAPKEKAKPEKKEEKKETKSRSVINKILKIDIDNQGKGLKERMKEQPQINKEIKETVDKIAMGQGYKGMSVSLDVNRYFNLIDFLEKVQYPNKYTSEAQRDVHLKIYKEGLNYGQKKKEEIKKIMDKKNKNLVEKREEEIKKNPKPIGEPAKERTVRRRAPDPIADKRDKELKEKLKGKGKAEEKPVEQPKDSFSIGKFPFKIKVDDRNIILKKKYTQTK